MTRIAGALCAASSHRAFHPPLAPAPLTCAGYRAVPLFQSPWAFLPEWETRGHYPGDCGTDQHKGYPCTTWVVPSCR
jgi:hypothetical protein